MKTRLRLPAVLANAPHRSRSIKLALLGTVTVSLLTSCPDPRPVPPPVSTVCNLTPEQWATLENPAHSEARIWNELALNGIRNVLPQPTVHARTLFHLSAAMYDVWASSDAAAQGVFWNEKHAATPFQLRESVAFAARRVLHARYFRSVPGIAACFDDRLKRAGYNVDDESLTGDSASAIGNRAGQAVLNASKDDGANEANSYADTSHYSPANEPLEPQFGGSVPVQPDHWQPLLLAQPFTQNGIALASGPQPFMGAHWGSVRPFAMKRPSAGAFYHDPGPAPSLSDPRMLSRWIPELLRRQAALDPVLDATIDLSPGALGNNPLGSDAGTGHPLNPVTGLPYPSNAVKMADFGRVIAEYWADGPKSETPPGHWNVLANEVADAPGFQRRLDGSGPQLGPLEWDIKMYLALNGALHDAAISAWDVKRQTDTARPISLVHTLAAQGLLPLEPGLVEQRDGTLQVRGWNGQATWLNARQWTPYQRSDFVSPAFPAFVSGHSAFSRAAAEVLTDLTGSAYFPGGLHEVAAPAGFVQIGLPSNASAVRLQWATYFDAADQAGQSRIWGGIHIGPDDLAGRRVGHQVGLDAVTLARRYFLGQAR
jgi:hypothetical protein